jgi:hypothetical protein
MLGPSFLEDALNLPEKSSSSYNEIAFVSGIIPNTQCCGSGSAWIRIKWKGRIQIRIRIIVISWIRIRTRINLHMTNQNIWNMSLLENFFKVLSFYLKARIRIRITLILIRIKVTSTIRIRIRIKGMRIRNTANTCIRFQQTKLMWIYEDPELKLVSRTFSNTEVPVPTVP